MAAHQVTIDDLEFAFNVSHDLRQIGDIRERGINYQFESGSWLESSQDVENLVISVNNGNPVYLRDIAKVKDGARSLLKDTWYRTRDDLLEKPAVFISIAKQKGANAVTVSKQVNRHLANLAENQLPEGVKIAIIRDYGQTASDKVNNLVTSLGIAVVTVVVFVGLTLNWRSAMVVAIAIPVSYGATLGVDWLFGYTINRVTLFALILSLGLIVDDPIASIDNIERYLRKSNYSATNAIVSAMNEIRGALLMSTVAIVIVFTPMFFISGMMGPYMGPLAFNVPISVLFSTLVAFMITPWLAGKLLKPQAKQRPKRILG